jgi:GNAT superfamily N-acetyltransferase
MISTLRTDSENQNFIALVAELDTDLGERDGEEHAFYHQFNSIQNLKYAIVLYLDEKPVGCGAIKAFNANTMEVKRMYILPEARGKKLATHILNELELWAFDLGYKICILETGKRQPEAIALYTKNGYEIIPNYGQYVGIENSVCFQKHVSF